MECIVVDSTPGKGTTFMIYLRNNGEDALESDKSDKKPLKEMNIYFIC